MKEDANIKEKLQSEMSRLKRAIDYIEQAEKCVQEIQEVNMDYKSRHEDLLKLNSESNRNIKSIIDGFEKRLQENSDNFDATSKSVEALDDAINQQDASMAELRTVIENIEKRIDTLSQNVEKRAVSLEKDMVKRTMSLEQDVEKRVSALEGENEYKKRAKWYHKLFG